MAIRDTWHRALVYFGLADDPEYRYDEDDDYYDEPATIAEEAAPPRRRSREAAPSNVRRLRRDDPGDIDDIFGDEPAPRRQLRPVGNGGNDNVQVHFVTPRNFNDAQEIADKFKRSVPVILNLQSASTDLSKRLIDFGSGLTYALDGGMQRIADKTFLLTPANVEVSAEEKARLVEKGFFNQS
jgi:cell division inhibitor SepF